jgi:hypothetical protein
VVAEVVDEPALAAAHAHVQHLVLFHGVQPLIAAGEMEGEALVLELPLQQRQNLRAAVVRRAMQRVDAETPPGATGGPHRKGRVKRAWPAPLATPSAPSSSAPRAWASPLVEMAVNLPTVWNSSVFWRSPEHMPTTSPRWSGVAPALTRRPSLPRSGMRASSAGMEKTSRPSARPGAALGTCAGGACSQGLVQRVAATG